MNNEQLTQENVPDHVSTSDSQASTPDSVPPATQCDVRHGSAENAVLSTPNSQLSPSPPPAANSAFCILTSNREAINKTSGTKFEAGLEANSELKFPRSPGETPRAYGAFVAFFQLGSARTLPMLAEKLGESPGTIKNWSSRFNWTERIQSFNSGLLQLQARAETALQLERSAEWAKRVNEFREQEWGVSQELLASARCFLQSYGDEQLKKMTLAQVSRAVDISSRIGRLALSGSSAPDQSPEMSPVQKEIAAALKRMYDPAPSTPPLATPNAELSEPRQSAVGGQPLVAPKSNIGASTTTNTKHDAAASVANAVNN